MTIPVADGLGLDPKGKYHLIFAEPCAFEKIYPRSRPEEAEVFVVGSPRSLGTDARKITFLPSRGALLSRLAVRLAEAKMGSRLYLLGPMAFLTAAETVARSFGMGESEIRRFESPGAGRRVYCVHCRTISENILGDALACPGCERRLGVRKHFSRRLGAHLGVFSHGGGILR